MIEGGEEERRSLVVSCCGSSEEIEAYLNTGVLSETLERIYQIDLRQRKGPPLTEEEEAEDLKRVEAGLSALGLTDVKYIRETK